MRDYKLIKKELEKAQGVSNGAQYDRAVLLLELMDNPGYVEDCKRRAIAVVVDIDMYASGMFANCTELRIILKKFPKRAQWVSGNLRGMRQETVKTYKPTIRPNGKKPGKEKGTRHVVTQREHEELAAELAAAKQKIKYLEKEVSQLRQDQLQKAHTIERLEARLDRALGVVDESRGTAAA